jgi:hypothetical protein
MWPFAIFSHCTAAEVNLCPSQRSEEANFNFKLAPYSQMLLAPCW